jgi:molecular chaperone GrpE
MFCNTLEGTAIMVEDQAPSKPDSFEELLECEKKRSQDYLTRLKYMQADYENAKKRFEREAEQIKSHCTERIVLDLIEVVDELELATKNGSDSPSTQCVIQGVEMTLKKLRKLLEKEGVCEIANPQGQCFDPKLHNAVAVVECNDVAESTVLEQIRKGYQMRNRVIRPSIVKVSVKPNPKNECNQSEEKQN